ncbi:MAG: phosphatidate cytidylyltransferase [candidate division NC10 bacterium]|jgi:phosphatidate cytidylyltransferase|nr:phosphatidate cytidylyltransferase [candidate division NC10 bacterium]MCZ6550789.1 phosphatidate cytidylyltransferase [candidate division NC10 bacterium]
MNGKRVLSAFFLLSLFLLVVIYGGEAGFALLGMGVAVISLWEFTRLVDDSPGVSRVLALVGGVVLVGATYLGGVEWFGLAVVLFLLLQLCPVVVGGGEIEASLRRATFSFLGVVYVAGPLSLAVSLRGMPGGERYILLACAIVWVGDTGAFYAGSSLGHHPLAPRVSPRKSVEGSVGGLVASMAVVWILARALDMPVAFLSSLLVGAVVGGAGQMGDLVESVIKRAFQVKDTGCLIPGHGGMLDRIDSLLFAIPVFYLWVRAGWI